MFCWICSCWSLPLSEFPAVGTTNFISSSIKTTNRHKYWTCPHTMMIKTILSPSEKKKQSTNHNIFSTMMWVSSPFKLSRSLVQLEQARQGTYMIYMCVGSASRTAPQINNTKFLNIAPSAVLEPTRNEVELTNIRLLIPTYDQLCLSLHCSTCNQPKVNPAPSPRYGDFFIPIHLELRKKKPRNENVLWRKCWYEGEPDLVTPGTVSGNYWEDPG